MVNSVFNILNKGSAYDRATDQVESGDDQQMKKVVQLLTVLDSSLSNTQEALDKMESGTAKELLKTISSQDKVRDRLRTKGKSISSEDARDLVQFFRTADKLIDSKLNTRVGDATLKVALKDFRRETGKITLASVDVAKELNHFVKDTGETLASSFASRAEDISRGGLASGVGKEALKVVSPQLAAVLESVGISPTEALVGGSKKVVGGARALGRGLRNRFGRGDSSEEGSTSGETVARQDDSEVRGEPSISGDDPASLSAASNEVLHGIHESLVMFFSATQDYREKTEQARHDELIDTLKGIDGGGGFFAGSIGGGGKNKGPTGSKGGGAAKGGAVAGALGAILGKAKGLSGKALGFATRFGGPLALMAGAADSVGTAASINENDGLGFFENQKDEGFLSSKFGKTLRAGASGAVAGGTLGAVTGLGVGAIPGAVAGALAGVFGTIITDAVSDGTEKVKADQSSTEGQKLIDKNSTTVTELQKANSTLFDIDTSLRVLNVGLGFVTVADNSGGGGGGSPSTVSSTQPSTGRNVDLPPVTVMSSIPSPDFAKNADSPYFGSVPTPAQVPTKPTGTLPSLHENTQEALGVTPQARKDSLKVMMNAKMSGMDDSSSNAFRNLAMMSPTFRQVSLGKVVGGDRISNVAPTQPESARSLEGTSIFQSVGGDGRSSSKSPNLVRPEDRGRSVKEAAGNITRSTSSGMSHLAVNDIGLMMVISGRV